MDKLTKIQRNKYLKGGGCQCPYCGSENIKGRPFETDSALAWQPVVCLSCNKEWDDVYKLIGIDTTHYDER